MITKRSHGKLEKKVQDEVLRDPSSQRECRSTKANTGGGDEGKKLKEKSYKEAIIEARGREF